MKKEKNNLDDSQKKFLDTYVELMEKEGLSIPKGTTPCKTNRVSFSY